MPHDRFIVAGIYQNEGYGFVRQVDPQNAPLLNQAIRFDLTKASQINYEELHGELLPTGYEMTDDPAITERVPFLGTELYGSVAYDAEPWRLAIGPDGNPFLRNWGYVDQPPVSLDPVAQRVKDETDVAWRELDTMQNLEALLRAIDRVASDLGVDLDDGSDVDYGYGRDDLEIIEEWPEEDEDPLAGDVEPTGGYYVPPVHPFEAQRLAVMRQHGDYTG